MHDDRIDSWADFTLPWPLLACCMHSSSLAWESRLLSTNVQTSCSMFFALLVLKVRMVFWQANVALIGSGHPLLKSQSTFIYFTNDEMPLSTTTEEGDSLENQISESIGYGVEKQRLLCWSRASVIFGEQPRKGQSISLLRRTSDWSQSHNKTHQLLHHHAHGSVSLFPLLNLPGGVIF